MINQILEFCTSNSGLGWLVLGSDLAIALSYFAIPVIMAAVLRDRREDIPYPWLWTLFVTFIVACGLTHTVHVWSALMGTQYLSLQASIGVLAALASVGTAISFMFILPQIKLLPSPKQQRLQLEILIGERTKEKDRLIREIHHRIGNQLQVMSSLVSIETRNAAGQEALDILARLKNELDKMTAQHVELSQQNYLGQGIGVEDGRTSGGGAAGAASPGLAQ